MEIKEMYEKANENLKARLENEQRLTEKLYRYIIELLGDTVDTFSRVNVSLKDNNCIFSVDKTDYTERFIEKDFQAHEGESLYVPPKVTSKILRNVLHKLENDEDYISIEQDLEENKITISLKRNI